MVHPLLLGRAVTTPAVVLLLLLANPEARQPVARVLGQNVFLEDLVPAAELENQPPEKVLSMRRLALGLQIMGAVFEDYVRTHKLTPTEAESTRCAQALRDPKDAEWNKHPVGPEERQLGAWVMQTWKRDVALYREFGGRMIFQQAGPEPIDAWTKVVEQYEAKRAFVILDPAMSGAAYDYMKQKFYDVGPDGIREFIALPICLWPAPDAGSPTR